MTAPALEARGLARNFGALIATDDVSFAVQPGARQALIGPNGAGKTTLINLLTGVIKPTAGQVLLEGRDVTGLPSSARVQDGPLAHVPDQSAVSRSDARRVARPRDLRAQRLRRRLLARGGRRSRRSSPKSRTCSRVSASKRDLDQPTRKLPYGKQRLLEIALALAARPRVLLLDEPAAGVPEEERQDILAALAALPADVAILLIEHDMDLVFNFASRISVLVAGTAL